MKKASLFILFIFTGLGAIAQIPTTSLVGYWPFNGNANDLSGNSNNGTVSGATLTTDRFGNPNSAYGFNGVNAQITVPNSTSIDMASGTDFSIAFWEKTYTAPNNDAALICKNQYGSQSGYMFFSNNTNPGYCTTSGQLSFYVAASSAGDACANNAIATGTNLNTWFFIVGVYDATLNQAKLYVNGVLQSDIGSAAGALSTPLASLVFGSTPTGGSFFKGALDDIRIYKTKLTQAQITAIQNECGVSTPTLVNITPSANQLVCSGISASLSVSGSSLVNWYSSPTSTSVLGTGTLFVTPSAGPGSYTLYAENATCPSTGIGTRAAVAYTSQASPTISVNSGTICAGSSFTLSPVGASSFSYSSGSPVVSPAATAYYTVTGTDPNGCMDSKTSTVTVNALPVISVNSGTLCAGSVFTLNPSGASAYVFSGGSNLVSPASTTVYSVTGTSSAGCVSSNTALATVNVLAAPVVSVNSGSVCSGAVFTIVPSGASGYTFSAGAATVSPVFNSTYTVTGISSAGCLSAPAISSVSVVPLPATGITGSMAICSGGSAVITATGALSYQWNTGAVTTSISLSPQANTNYSVVGTGAGGCQSMAVKTLTVWPNPNVTASASSTQVCLGNLVTLQGGGALGYSWSGAVVNAVPFTPAASSGYTVTGTDIRGCQGTAALVIVVNNLPQIGISATGTAICTGGSVKLTVTGVASYTWSSGVSNGVPFFPSLTGTYSVTGMDSNGCLNSASIVVVVNSLPNLVVSSSNPVICPEETATLNVTGANLYTWSTGGNSAQVVVSPASASNYTVTGTDLNGCSKTVVFTQSVSLCTSLNEIAGQGDESSIYPNPNNGSFTFETSANGIRLRIYSFTGQLVVDQDTEAGKTAVDLMSHSSGIYFAEVYQNGLKRSFKIVKQ